MCRQTWWFIALLSFWAFPAQGQEPVWRSTGPGGETQVHLYFFWSAHCPHCLEARPWLLEQVRREPWIVLHDEEVMGSAENRAHYLALAKALGGDASSVPAFVYCGRMEVGFRSVALTGDALLQRLRACRDGGDPMGRPGSQSLDIPLLGEVDTAQVSLPFFTLVIAGLDAFNPCAFFVLLFLLSLLIRERSRWRMLLVGGIFVLFSGLIYFAFMTAWLNVFLWAGELSLVTEGAGVAAVLVALLNIKDFFLLGQGPSLSIPSAAKPGLFQRMKNLAEQSSLVAMVAGAAALAVVANSYELLCTAGFPMVYTRALTLHGLGQASYYGYLAFYNLVYVLPLAAIVGVFTYTLGARKLQESEGRFLKLMSGLMMLGLGVLLLAAPRWLSNPLAALGLIAIAAGFSLAAKRWWRK